MARARGASAGVGGTLIAPALAVVGIVAGCVTETTHPRNPGLVTRNGSASTTAPSVDLTKPIARPAMEGKTVNARVLAQVAPLGSVPFDGQVLPLVSPDGKRLATEVGEAPSWDALLGRRAGGPTLRTGIEVWDISASPAKRVELASALTGIMLGRSCDARGFLVEENRPDGARRIGRADWLTGKITWLADDGRVNAFAELLPGGGTAWCARDIDATTFELVVNGKRVAGGPGMSFLFPMSSGEPDALYVFEASNFGMEVQARSLRADPAAAAKAAGGSYVVARRSIGASADAVVAYQAADSERGCVDTLAKDAPPPGLLFFHPGAKRMAIFDAGRGQMIPLADESIAGAWAPDDAGWAVVVTTPLGLEHQRLTMKDGLWDALPAARALGDPWVARRTASPHRRFVLLGPDAKDPRKLIVVGMELLKQ